MSRDHDDHSSAVGSADGHDERTMDGRPRRADAIGSIAAPPERRRAIGLTRQLTAGDRYDVAELDLRSNQVAGASAPPASGRRAAPAISARTRWSSSSCLRREQGRRRHGAGELAAGRAEIVQIVDDSTALRARRRRRTRRGDRAGRRRAGLGSVARHARPGRRLRGAVPRTVGAQRGRPEVAHGAGRCRPPAVHVRDDGTAEGCDAHEPQRGACSPRRRDWARRRQRQPPRYRTSTSAASAGARRPVRRRLSIVLPEFAVGAVEAITAHRVTHVVLVPAVLPALLDAASAAGSDVSSLQTIVYGAAPISESVLARAGGTARAASSRGTD